MHRGPDPSWVASKASLTALAWDEQKLVRVGVQRNAFVRGFGLVWQAEEANDSRCNLHVPHASKLPPARKPSSEFNISFASIQCTRCLDHFKVP